MLRFFVLINLISLFFFTSTFAHSKSPSFMTPQDIKLNETSSNINLQNNRALAATVFGLYVRQFSYVRQGQSCSNATIIYSTTQNITAGSVVMPTRISPHQRAALGQNYLYNMIYAAIYYVNVIIPSSPPGCALPGCTWGTDTTRYNWCIYLGALAPVSTSPGFTANVPPATSAASTPGQYDFNLVSNFTYLGPIACNDQTLTCAAATQQTQTFS